MVSFTPATDRVGGVGGTLWNAALVNAIYAAIEKKTTSVKTSSYSATTADDVIQMDCTGGSRTLTLPSAVTAGAGRFFQVDKTDTSTNALTVATTGGQTIDGLSSVVLYGRVSITVMSNGANLTVVSGKAFINPLALHPQWFGAKLDNSTDDTAALQAAITACIASGRPLRLPRGSSVARVTDTITVGNAQGQRLDIDGSGGTIQIIYDGANNKSVFKMQGLKQSAIRGVNIRVNPGITGVRGWELAADATYTSLSFVSFYDCTVDFGIGSGGVSNGIGYYIHDDGASRDMSFLNFHNCCVHGQGRAYGDKGWINDAPNGLNYNWFGGSALGVDTGVDLSAVNSGEGMLFDGFGTSTTNVDVVVPRYGNVTILAGRFELGKKWISGVTGIPNIQHITAVGCDVSGYTPSDDCVILLGGATTLELDNCFVRNTNLTPYTAAFITVNANASVHAAIIVKGGSIQADDPFYTATSGIVKLDINTVRRLSSSSVASGWFQDRPRGVSADNGDAAKTLTAGLSSETQRWATALTANRAVALSTTGAFNGARFRVVRTAAATGAFSLQVGTGPLKSLAAGEWCEVEYPGSSWILTAAGSL